MSKLTEGKGVELPVHDWLTKMGWTPRTSADLKVYNRPLSNPLIEGILMICNSAGSRETAPENLAIVAALSRRDLCPGNPSTIRPTSAWHRAI